MIECKQSGTARPGSVLFAAFAIPLVFIVSACAQQKPPPANQALSKPAKVESVPAAPVVAAAAPRVNAQRAMQYLREIVAFGPRPVGSAGHRKLQAYLRSHLKADNLEEDTFTAQTPEGPMAMTNFIAKFPGAKDGLIVIAGHYDTYKPVRNFVGANDAGSSTALLLELANHLRGKKRAGYSVWLVFLDGEEAVRQWSPVDSLYGSRHLAQKWQNDGAAQKIKAFLLIDMIGDADLSIDRDQNSTTWLVQLIYEAAARLGYQSYFFRRTLAIEDDHMPFLALGIPAIDLIDFEYGYGNAVWHTPEDTLDKISPKSMAIVGNVLLQAVAMLDAR
jgi:Zn-dependent M28 family amino/carboxypeptidase